MIMLTDFHSHVLPNVDDGSSSIKQSLAMLRMEADQGIKHVIATPHFYANDDTPERFIRRRGESARRLEDALREDISLPKVSLGAEDYYFSGMSNSDILPALTINGTRYIMVEMPMSPWSKEMYRELENIYIRQGLIPIIAHMDRYIGVFQSYGIPETLQQLPVLVQVNAGFFLRFSTKRMAMRLMKEDKIHLLGSDCHNILERRPNLGDAISYIQSCSSEKIIEKINFYEHKVLTDDIFLLR